MLRGLKQFKGCECCGWKPSNPRLLHFHHRDPETKLFNVSQSIHSQSWPKILLEIAKCAILCLPCHIHLEGQYEAHQEAA